MTQSGHGYVTREWGDGSYTFRLSWGGLKELQDKCACGPAELFWRLMSHKWLVDDLYEIVRLGLVGGGKTPVDAMKLAHTYVKERPLLESVPIAVEIVSASLFGPPEEARTEGEPLVAGVPGMGVSLSPPSMVTAQ